MSKQSDGYDLRCGGLFVHNGDFAKNVKKRVSVLETRRCGLALEGLLA